MGDLAGVEAYFAISLEVLEFALLADGIFIVFHDLASTPGSLIESFLEVLEPIVEGAVVDFKDFVLDRLKAKFVDGLLQSESQIALVSHFVHYLSIIYIIKEGIYLRQLFLC